MKQFNDKIRNIAIIAHVDHGKTTLVDYMFRQSGTFRENEEVVERVMDNMDLERERGITIAAKNCSMTWKGVKINVVDTPGHADFGGEVERALMMVDGAVLLVDAAEGPLPQTRFVLRKALERGLRLIVVINKLDRKDARPVEVLNEIFDLFIDLDATDHQAEFPLLYAIGREGIAKATIEEEGKDLAPLFEMILKELPPPSYDTDEPFQMLVTDLGYSDYLGRLAIGKIAHGSAKRNDPLVRINAEGVALPLKVTSLQTYRGVKIEDVEEAAPGDVIILAGVEDVNIGDTISTREAPRALPRVSVDEPTVSVMITINSSPFTGREGKFVRASQIRERLLKEALRNVALHVKMTDETDEFIVEGRGEFQMVILAETLRREGYELSIGRPQVIYKGEGPKRLEPIERLFVDCDERHMGVVIEKLSRRKGRMVNLVNHGSGRVRLEISIPTRGLIGYRNEFLTDTKGTGIMSSYLDGYEQYRGDFPTRTTGSLVSNAQGDAVTYALETLEGRGPLFITPGEKVYEGMIIGEHCRENDLIVNPCKTKKLTNVRAKGKEMTVILTPVTPVSLESGIEFIRDDELVEVTPKSIRLRKARLFTGKPLPDRLQD
ncbi:MAG: translational GTPase TypA [Candidatus Brocadiia bacterium]